VVVTAVMVEPDDHGAGEKDGGEDENDPGNDHYPRCGHIEPGGLDSLVHWWCRLRSCRDGSRLR
jgi:hypothetical protein